MNYGLSESAEIILSKSIFYVKNQQNFFKKKYLRLSIFEPVEKNEHLISAIWSSAKNHGPKCIKEINIIFTFRKIKPYFDIELLNHMVFKRQISIGTPKSKNK